jgi:hypothetical protein
MKGICERPKWLGRHVNVPQGGVVSMKGIYERLTWWCHPYEGDMCAPHMVGSSL